MDKVPKEKTLKLPYTLREKTDVIQTAVEIQLSVSEAERLPNALPKLDSNPNTTGNEWTDGQTAKHAWPGLARRRA